MQIVTRETPPMSIPFRPRREPATAENTPVTPESIQAAKDAAQRELDADTRRTGVQFVNHRPVLHGGIPREVREKCGEAIDAVVEQFGLEAVIRSVQLVAAVNGRSLR